MNAAFDTSAYPNRVCRYRPTARDVARDQRAALRDMAVACLVAAACILVVLGVGTRSTANLRSVEEGVSFEQTFVQDGESLWTLAEEHPVRGMSTRQVVDLVIEQNGLSTSLLLPGQSILVPTSASSVIA